MDTSLLLSIISIALSAIAAATSSILVLRQVKFQRQANQLPIIINLLQEYRSPSFQGSQIYVQEVLPYQHDAMLGVSNLPDEARQHVARVSSLFSSLSVLVVHGITEESLVISLLGYPARRNWETLRDYVLRERDLRGDGDFLNYFEHLACQVRDNWPPVSRYNLKLRKWSP